MVLACHLAQLLLAEVVKVGRSQSGFYNHTLTSRNDKNIIPTLLFHFFNEKNHIAAVFSLCHMLYSSLKVVPLQSISR